MSAKELINDHITVIWDNAAVQEKILNAFNLIGFKGLNLPELRERAKVPKQITEGQLKSALGRLIAEGRLEYVDSRCYRIYPCFLNYMARCNAIDDRNKKIIERRLQGELLQEIASTYGMTRERVSQIIVVVHLLYL